MLSSVPPVRVRLVRVIAFVSFTVSACYSQTEPLHELQGMQDFPSQTIRQEVQEVNLILTITDHRNHFIPNLTASEISIRDNGEAPERITYFEAQTHLPLRVALVIDCSASVSYWFEAQKRAAEDFLKHMLHNGTDVAMVIGFNEQAYLAQAPTRDYSQLSRAIKGLHADGETAIYDAVGFASQALIGIDNDPSRRAIVLITDGEDNASHMTLMDAAEISQQNQSIVYILGTRDVDPRNKAAEQQMKQLAEVSGGEYWSADDQERIARALEKIEKDLRNQYAIAYRPPNARPDGSFHRISILVPKKLRVRHRRGYFAR